MKENMSEKFTPDRYVIVDLDTGDVVDGGVRIYGADFYIKCKEAKRKRKERECIRKANAPEQKDARFVFHIYHACVNNFPDMQPSHITRLMYIATYLSYDGRLLTDWNAPMNKGHIERFLKLSKTSFYEFWEDMVKRGIFTEKDDGIYLNKDIFFKGDLTDKQVYRLSVDNIMVTRLYVTGIRKLYERSTPRSHKTLSYIFQILPYVNKQYNIICKNPLEEDYDLIEPMTLGEFADVIGYNKKNVGRLANLLLEPTFDIQEDEDVTAIRYVITKSLKKESMMMFINPRVYYAGDYADKVKALGVFK